MLREYSKLGLRVYAVGRKDDVGIKSRHGRISVMHEDSDLVPIANEILSLGLDNSLAFITSDYFLQLICNSHPGLLCKFEFTISSTDTLRILTDKRATYEHAAGLSIRSPKTFEIKNCNTIEPASLPLILKWNETPLGTRVPFKTRIIEDRESLASIASSYESFAQYLILQQIVVGTDLSYAGVFDRGKEILSCVTRKNRQFPIWGGLGSYVSDYVGPIRDECHESGRALAESLEVHGYIEVEFKYDKHGRLYVIEANPRIWGWAKFLKLKYSNFPELLLNPRVEPVVNPELCKWFSLLRDLRALWALAKHEKDIRVLTDFIISYKGTKTFDILDLRDLKPFLYQFYKGVWRGG